MSNYVHLAIGELTRMKKYQVLPATFFIALLWMGFLYLVDSVFINQLFSILIYVDVTTMAILFVGVTLFFERKEGTLRSLQVAPVRTSEYVLAKATGNLFANMLTFVLLFVFAYWVKAVDVNFIGFVSAVAVVGFFHAMLGFLLTYHARDFTALLMYAMAYAIVFVVPVLLEQLGFISDRFVSGFLYLLPTKAAMLLFSSAAGGNVETWELLLSAGYLTGAGLVLFAVALGKFAVFAGKEGGV